MSVRVIVTRQIHATALDRLVGAGLDVVRPDPGADLSVLAAEADVLVTQLTDVVDERVLAAGNRLRLVANVAAGYDNIDLDAARRFGVGVSNTPGVLTEATADLAFALLLAVARRIPENDAELRRDTRVRWTLIPDTMGLDVSGRTLGILGMGGIGLAVARRALLGFGMPVLFSGGSGAAADEARALGAREVDRDALLRDADFVSLHTPLTEATRGLIDADALARMRPTAVLINTARGPIVDERALADALSRGVIAGAGLDVFEEEPAVLPELLAMRERVVLTPHVGSATAATRLRMSEIAVANVLAVASGDAPTHPVLWPHATGQRKATA